VLIGFGDGEWCVTETVKAFFECQSLPNILISKNSAGLLKNKKPPIGGPLLYVGDVGLAPPIRGGGLHISAKGRACGPLFAFRGSAQ
jgi:hypothetical protein